MTLTHHQILVLRQMLGYDKKISAGACSGFSSKGIDAFFSENPEKGEENQLASFYKRLIFIKKHPKLTEEILPILEKIKSQGFNELDNREKKFHAKYLDILGFFDGVELYQNPAGHIELFGKKLNQIANFIDISKLAQSLAVEAQGGISKLGDSLSAFTVTDLKTYIRRLKLLLDKQPQKLALSINSKHHKIAVCYDSNRKRWIIIDANNPKKQFYDCDAADAISSKKLAKIICEQATITHAHHGDLYLLYIQAYCKSNDREQLSPLFDTFKASSAYQNATKMTPEKARYVYIHPENIVRPHTLLDMAVMYNMPDMISQLKNEGVDLNKRRPLLNSTPLEIALFCNFPEIVDALANNGVDINQFVTQGLPRLRINLPPCKTAAHVAVKHNNIELLRVLDKHHINFRQISFAIGSQSFRKTPLAYARKIKHDNAADFIESAMARDELLTSIDALKTENRNMTALKNKIINDWRKHDKHLSYALFNVDKWKTAISKAADSRKAAPRRKAKQATFFHEKVAGDLAQSEDCLKKSSLSKRAFKI